MFVCLYFLLGFVILVCLFGPILKGLYVCLLMVEEDVVIIIKHVGRSEHTLHLMFLVV